MKVVCVGGGPSGLYFAICAKLKNASHQITVLERNRPDDAFGWGVVLSDQTLADFNQTDPVLAERVGAELAHWDDIDVIIRGRTITSSGHGFSGVGRKRMLALLQDRARELGVDLWFETEVSPDDPRLADADLVLASDGANSRLRKAREDAFGVDVELRRNRYVWLGTTKPFNAFTFDFRETEHGWVWAHAYRFEPGLSTFILECSPETWAAAGFDRLDADATCRTGERLFAETLDGHALQSNARHKRGSAWLQFPRIRCRTWRDENTVLIGDAAHTAHFSIGSGTKLALEDAASLAQNLHREGSLEARLDAWQAEREVEVLKLQSAARNSTEWFENVDRYAKLEPEQFAYSLLTRSQRVSHENLRLRDGAYLHGLERWFAERATGRPVNDAPPPMFTPLRLRELEIPTRVVVSPMCMYSAVDGTPGEFHLVHYGSRAMGGAGLVMTEMTDVSAEGRITPGCTGMYAEEHVAAWKRIVDFVHANSDAKIGVQLAHAGRKGSTKPLWEGEDEPLDTGNWELIAPSPLPWSPKNQTPREMTRADMDVVRDQFVRATERALEAGFDLVELHCGHGYLLSSFLTPVSNRRTDDYGGSLQNRLRFPLEVFRAMRAAWPEEKPMSVRLSATDWVEEGLTPEESVEIGKAFAAVGADLIDVSAGQTTPDAKPVYGRMFQTPFADRIRNEAGVPVMAVGNIYEPDHVNSILAAGRADLCALARPHLADPAWSLRQAAASGCDAVQPPKPYRAGFQQLRRNLEREKLAGAV